MNSKKFSEALSELDNKYIDEAIHYKKKAKKPVWVKLGTVAACLALALALVPFHGSRAISAYVYGTDEEITAVGVVMDSGTINDKGEMKGHPLMFYLSGKDIETVRFSCKNQQINFIDWTEKRDEYGNAQNFTVAYGEDESDYYYLTIDWVPNTIIRELTDNAEATIATLPAEMREDIIVMEITFANGKTATKAITVSLLEDGTFSASFDGYEITAEDSFVERIDSESIPRDILYEQGANAGQSEEQSLEDVAAVDENDEKTDLYESETANDLDKQDTASENIDDTATSSETQESERNTQSIFDELAGLEYQQYTCDGLPEYSLTADDGTTYYMNFSEKWVWREKEEQAELPDGIISWLEANGETVSMENLNEDILNADEIYRWKIITVWTAEQIEDAKQSALAYYEGTVFSVNTIEYTEEKLSYGDEGGCCNFIVNVSKDGVVQEPNRTITLQLDNDIWKVVNEGY